MTSRAPKQWVLTKNETINTYESWKQNIQYVLSLDASFAPFHHGRRKQEIIQHAEAYKTTP